MNFEFAPSKFPPRKTAAGKPVAAKKAAPAAKTPAAKTAAKTAAKKVAAKKVAVKAAAKAPRKASTAAGLQPSAALAAVIGNTPVARTEVIRLLWDYIKAQGLQDPKDKRTILADAKLQAVFGKPSINMFELAGIVGKHLG